MQNKMLQAFYRPSKAKSQAMNFKALEEMEKALESGVKAIKGKKKRDDE